jgi:hypothetical protein
LYGAESWPTKRWHVQQLSVAEMRMLRWICGNIRRDRVRNDDIRERLGVAPVEEKLVQHRLRWFGHIQRRPAEAPVRNGVIRWSSNEKRGRGRSNLIWEEFVKRDLKDWCITKELALDRRVEASNSCAGTLIFGSFFFIVFCQSFLFRPISLFFGLTFYCLFSFFLSSFVFLLFRHCFIPVSLTRVVSSLAYPNLLGTKRLGCCCCCCGILYMRSSELTKANLFTLFSRSLL